MKKKPTKPTPKKEADRIAAANAEDQRRQSGGWVPVGISGWKRVTVRPS